MISSKIIWKSANNLRHVKILVSNRRYANNSIYGRLLRRPSATRYVHDPKRYWEVIDRTTEKWFRLRNGLPIEENNTITIEGTRPFHEYTVSFLVYAIWDPTQMYNHITNNWGDVPHDIPFDVRGPHSNQFMHSY